MSGECLYVGERQGVREKSVGGKKPRLVNGEKYCRRKRRGRRRSISMSGEDRREER